MGYAVHQIRGGNSRARKGHLKATANQRTFLADLIAQTGYEKDIPSTREEVSDLIEVLKVRRRKMQAH